MDIFNYINLSKISNIDIFQLIGFAGMLCIVYAYFLHQIKGVGHNSLRYQLLNLIGAILLTISLLVHFNLGSFLIEIFWIVITLYGMIKNKRGK